MKDHTAIKNITFPSSDHTPGHTLNNVTGEEVKWIIQAVHAQTLSDGGKV